MLFPIIPLLALVALLGGAGASAWYANLSREEKEEADRIANNYAHALFEKTLEQLTAAEAKQVQALTRRHFDN